jgi:hypothetical protein
MRICRRPIERISREENMVFRKSGWWMIVVVLVLGLFLLNGCGDKKSEQKKAGDVTKMTFKDGAGKEVNVNVQGGKIQIEGQGSKTEMTETSTWPAEMFPDVPQFTFGRIERVIKAAEEGGMRKFNIFYVNVEDGALNKYADMLRKNGWQVSHTQMDKSGILNGQKGNLGLNFPYNMGKRDGALLVYSVKN